MDAPKILNLHIADSATLQALYMPFLSGGGLFVPTTADYALAEQVFLLLALPGSQELYPLLGAVAWITPTASQHHRVQGVGLQFLEPGNRTQAAIDNVLASLPADTAVALTM